VEALTSATDIPGSSPLSTKLWTDGDMDEKRYADLIAWIGIEDYVLADIYSCTYACSRCSAVDPKHSPFRK